MEGLELMKGKRKRKRKNKKKRGKREIRE